MTRRDAIELLLDPAADAAVRREWAELRALGLPTQADNSSPTNAPHLTLVAGALADGALDELAGHLVASLLPAHAVLGRLTLLGDARLTLARAVELDAVLMEAVLELRAEATRRDPRVSRRPWVPHVSLARRLTSEQAATATTALSPLAPLPVTLTQARRWDFAARRVCPILPR
jgi:2'-5' RNA ligase